MQTIEVVFVVNSIWTTVSYGDTAKTEYVFEDKEAAFEFIQNFDPVQSNMKSDFVSMSIEAISFIKRKEN